MFGLVVHKSHILEAAAIANSSHIFEFKGFHSP